MMRISFDFDRVIKACNIASLNPYLVGIEIGSYSLKMVGMRLDKNPSILFCSNIAITGQFD